MFGDVHSIFYCKQYQFNRSETIRYDTFFYSISIFGIVSIPSTNP